jgi:hypothetical protein
MNRTVYISGLAAVITGLLLSIAQAQNFLTNGLIAYYRFDGTGNDTSGNSYNASLTNCTFGTNRFDQINTSLRLNGTNSSAKLPSLPFGGQFTISAWFECDAFSGKTYQRVFDFGNGAGIDNIILGQDGSAAVIRFELDDASGGNNVVKSAANLAAGKFYQAVCVLTNSQTMALFLNGQLVSQQNLSISYRQNNRTNNLLGISNFSGSSFFGGLIDDVRIYNRALSSNEVAQLYAIEFPVPPPLGISLYSNAPVVFYPTASGTNFSVQMATNLAAPVWVPVTNGIPFSGIQITNAPTNAFFRLN